MIGNDIVDLAQANRDSNWRRKGFRNKVFTEEEQTFLQQSGHDELMVWLLWSMKESVYKAAVRQSRQVVFAPSAISCRLLSDTNGTALGEVMYEGRQYTTHTLIQPQYVASYVQQADRPFLHEVVPLTASDYAFQHQTIRAHIRQQLSVRLSVADTAMVFEKDDIDIPFVRVNDQTYPLSISHHGFFGAYYIGL